MPLETLVVLCLGSVACTEYVGLHVYGYVVHSDLAAFAIAVTDSILVSSLKKKSGLLLRKMSSVPLNAVIYHL